MNKHFIKPGAVIVVWVVLALSLIGAEANAETAGIEPEIHAATCIVSGQLTNQAEEQIIGHRRRLLTLVHGDSPSATRAYGYAEGFLMALHVLSKKPMHLLARNYYKDVCLEKA